MDLYMFRLLSSRFIRSSAVIASSLGLAAFILLALSGMWPAQVTFGHADAAAWQAIDLQIDKLGPSTIQAGETVTYTLVVTNTSSVTLDNVVITDTWTLQSYGGAYQVEGGISVQSAVFVTQPVKYIQFNLAPMAPGIGGRIKMAMTIPQALQPNYTANPTIVGNSTVITTSTPNITANRDNVNTMIVGPVLRLTKTYTPTYPRPGQLLTYTFTLENKNRIDAIPATNVVITEVLPNYTTFYTAYPASIVTYYPTTRTVQWSLTRTVPVSSYTYVTLVVRLLPSTPYADINNLKKNCGVYAGGVPVTILCSTDVRTRANDTFEKVVDTISPPQQSGTISRTFPNRLLTYTVYVNNPYTQTLSGLSVTDTLPNYYSNPASTFRYVGLLAHSPPGPPTFTLTTTQIVAWRLPPIQAWDVYTFAFQAFVPPQMRINDNQAQQMYQNRVAGGYGRTALPTNDGGHDDKMKVYVVPQIRTIKTVTPTKQIFGLPVTYTLVLSNVGPTTITNIAITDVLPFRAENRCAFKWDGVVSGPSPYTNTLTSATWRNITLPGYTSWTVSFRAIVFGKLNEQCPNTVYGYSPDTYIVKWTNLAPVTVDVPFRYQKTVSPARVVLSGTIQYNVKEYNISGADAVMYGFTDTLPVGFYYNHSPIYTDMVGIPYTLMAYHQNEYSTTFPVQVISATVPGKPGLSWCDTLPGSVPQGVMSLTMRIISPTQLAGYWMNAATAAPVTVNPHVLATKRAKPTGALPGGVMTFTIVLSNNMPLTITNVRLTDTMPAGFTFGGVVSGTPPPAIVSPTYVVWTDLTILPHTRPTLAFTVTASSTVGKYTNEAKAVRENDPVICIPKAVFKDFPVSRGFVEVNKSASPNTVDPLGRFNYDISLKNIGPYTITIARFTDTLPGFSSDPWKFISMQSGDPAPVSEDPPAWENVTIPPNYTKHLRFTVRVGTLLNQYKNMLATDPPPVATGQFTATLPTGWELTTTKTYNGAPVTVRAGVGMDKEVAPTTAFTGSTVIYTITLVNQSGIAIENVHITDTLPSGFTFDGMVSGATPNSTDPLAWSLGTVPATTPNNKRVLAFRARVGNVAPGVYYNRVDASSTSILIPSTDNIAPVTVAGAPSLALDKSVLPPSVLAGNDVTYTLRLSNTEDAPLQLRVTDTLPSGFSFVSMVSGPAPTVALPRLVWSDLTAQAHATMQLVFRARVSPNASGTYYNQLDAATAWGTRLAGTGPTAPLAVTALPMLDLSKWVNPASVVAGREVTYSFELANNDPSQAVTARITDTLPAHFSFVGMVSGATPVITSPQVVWENLTIPANTRTTMSFRARVESTAPGGTYHNQLDGKSSLGNAFTGTGPTAPVQVSAAQIALSKSVAPDTTSPGGQVVYTINLVNVTAQPITARITDTLPAKLSFVDMIEGAEPIATSPQVVWSNVTVPANSTSKLIFRAQVALDAAYTTFYNQVDGSSGAVKFASTGPTAPLVVMADLDLGVSKSDGAPTSTIGSTVLYTIRYTNTSKANRTASNVVITDTFWPADYLTAIAPGWNMVSAGVYTRALGNLSPNSSHAVTFALQIAPNIPESYMAVSNTARIKSSTSGVIDPSPSNNASTDVNTIRGADIAVIGVITNAPPELRQGDTIIVAVTLKNQGVTSVTGPDGDGWFGTDLYVKPYGDPPPANAGDRYLGACPTDTNYCPSLFRSELFQATPPGYHLAPGESWALTFTYALPTAGRQWLYVQSDTFWGQNGDPDPTLYGSSQYGRIVEGNEDNNIYGPIEIYVRAAIKVYLPMVLKQY